MAQLDVQTTFAARQSLDRRLHPFDVTAVIRAPDVYHIRKAALVLIQMVSHIGSKIRICPIRFLQCTVDVVPEFRCFEQCLGTGFPIVGQFAFRRSQNTFVNQSLRTQKVNDAADFSGFHQLSFRREHVKLDAECRQIVPNHVKHGFGRIGTEISQPFAFGFAQPFVAVFFRQSLADGNQIISGVQSFGNGTDVFAQRFFIAKVRRTRQNINLRPGIVHVIFARYVISGFFQQFRQSVSENSAASVPDMHRSRRVRRNEFNIDSAAVSDIRRTERRSRFQYFFQTTVPKRFGQAHIDKAGTCNFNAFDNVAFFKPFNQQSRKITRLHTDLRRQNHRGIRRRIPVRRIARRLCNNAGRVHGVRQFAFGDKFFHGSNNFISDVFKDIHESNPHLRVKQTGMKLYCRSIRQTGNKIRRQSGFCPHIRHAFCPALPGKRQQIRFGKQQ